MCALSRSSRSIQIKTPEQIALMRVAGLLVGQTLEVLRAAAVPGITTRGLDALAEDFIRSHRGTPSFLGYHGFTGTICASVNDEVVHGIPGDRVLEEGDLLSLDCGAIVDGWHGDAAITVPIGEVPAAELDLLRAAEDAMWRGIAAATVGGRLTDLSYAIETSVDASGAANGTAYGIVEDFGGHGIGTEMHMEPHLLNYGRPGKGPRLVAGIALAVEPMITVADHRTRTLEDGWTVVTLDGSRAAHVEHTFALTAAGPWVLTALDGGAERLAALGVDVAHIPTP
jgi:methionyl aminopeptidase